MTITSATGAKIIYPDQQLTPLPLVQKLKGSLKTFGLFAGLTFVSVFIPILHFVLVPLFLFLTVFMTYASMKKNYLLTNFEVHCPQCDQKSTMNVVGMDLPLRTFCVHCRHLVYLSN